MRRTVEDWMARMAELAAPQVRVMTLLLRQAKGQAAPLEINLHGRRIRSRPTPRWTCPNSWLSLNGKRRTMTRLRA